MAKSRGSARRYAEAAFQIALRDGTVDVWLSDLEVATQTLGREDALRVLANPAVPYEARAALAERITEGSISAPALNLMRLLLRRGRIDLLPGVAQEFQRLHRRREGITEATIVSAATLGPTEEEALRARLTEMTGGRVVMDFSVDPAILGGVIVRLGDRLIDGSVRGRLERLRSRLAAGAL
ncbi:MAG: ATP synthase F1 subunit delta [Chloroflexota bacterium]|nr:ATP synthase F1 subunit delta [Chloroflexota bacterium]